MAARLAHKAQGHIFHAHSVRDFAEKIGARLREEGYPCSWDSQFGAVAAVSGNTVSLADGLPCILIWTHDNVSALSTRKAAQRASARNALIELTLDPIPWPFEGAKEPPLDFAKWSGGRDDPLWKQLMIQVRRVFGPPLGTPKLLDEAMPVLVTTGLAAVLASMLAVGRGGNPNLDQDLALLRVGPQALGVPNSDGGGLGGPLGHSFEPPPAIVRLHGKASAHFDRIEPAARIRLVHLRGFPVRFAPEYAAVTRAEDPAADTPLADTERPAL